LAERISFQRTGSKVEGAEASGGNSGTNNNEGKEKLSAHCGAEGKRSEKRASV